MNDKILVCGLGVMGKSISIDLSISDVKVYIYNWRNVEQKYKQMKSKVDYLYKKEKITKKQKNNFYQNISIIPPDFKYIDDINLIIECLPENKDKKIKFYNLIKNKIPNNTVIATNTSSLSINELANSFSNNQQFIGMHFFNPAYMMNLVEIIPSKYTSEFTKKHIISLLDKIEKEYVVINDSPGFIVNRLLITMINEAAFLLNDKIATKENIDKAMKLGANHPVGPLELADYIGIDIVYNILNNFNEVLNKDYKPCPIFKKLIGKNKLGKKTGEGFYLY